jgi:hypothetical protein
MDCKNFTQDVTRKSQRTHGTECREYELTAEDDTVALVIWTFAEPVAIIIAASIPVLRHLIEKPAQAAFERGLMGTRNGSGLPLDFAYPSSSRYERRAKIWSTGGNPTDTPIPLQTLGSRDGILRTDEVQVNIEEMRPDPLQDNYLRHDNGGRGAM